MYAVLRKKLLFVLSFSTSVFTLMNSNLNEPGKATSFVFLSIFAWTKLILGRFLIDTQYIPVFSLIRLLNTTELFVLV